MSDAPLLRSSPPVPLAFPSARASSPTAPEQIIVDLVSSSDGPENGVGNAPSELSSELSSDPRERVPVEPAEFSDLVEQVLSPLPFESNQFAQKAKERGEEQGESDNENEYDAPEGDSLKRKRGKDDKGKQRALSSAPASSEAVLASEISSDPSTAIPKASRLQVTGITSVDAIKNAVAIWEGRSQPPAAQQKNASIQHNNIRTLSDIDLAYPGQGSFTKKYGHCKYWMTREKKGGNIAETPKLIEGGTNNDAPRVVFNFPGITKGTKFYIYHVIAMEAALSGRNHHLSKIKLEAVSKQKNEVDALTVVHLCGHKWCLNADHYRIRAKRYNDQQVFCHFGLQSAADHRELKTIRDFYCKHSPNKCWTINYQGLFASDHQWEQGVPSRRMKKSLKKMSCLMSKTIRRYDQVDDVCGGGGAACKLARTRKVFTK